MSLCHFTSDFFTLDLWYFSAHLSTYYIRGLQCVLGQGPPLIPLQTAAEMERAGNTSFVLYEVVAGVLHKTSPCILHSVQRYKPGIKLSVELDTNIIQKLFSWRLHIFKMSSIFIVYCYIFINIVFILKHFFI